MEPPFIPLSQIREPRFLLRPVDKRMVAYMEMRDSIDRVGFINSICVVKQDGYYEVLDGNHRYSCAKDLGLEAIPCIVKEGLSDQEIMGLQIQAQAIRPEMKPVQFAQQMKKIMARDPDMDMTDLAALVNKNPKWIKDHLSLLRLDKPVQLMIDRGEIGLQNAYMLARIPKRMRDNYIEDAALMSAQDFKPIAAGVIKKFHEALRQGDIEAFYTAEIEATPYLRPLKEIAAEQRERIAGPAMVVAEKCKTPVDGFYAALKWMTHMDAESVMLQESRIARRYRQERMVELRGAARQQS